MKHADSSVITVGAQHVQRLTYQGLIDSKEERACNYEFGRATGSTGMQQPQDSKVKIKFTTTGFYYNIIL